MHGVLEANPVTPPETVWQFAMNLTAVGSESLKSILKLFSHTHCLTFFFVLCQLNTV